ncbi:hypothetical protein [Geodermatophilus sp. FMUSA9-8]|uniref:hypothetical protein n=1 Tax=Geodermatophilus sp. FMUSA9-8 TaxID=3120155 RepID=UPI0030095D50
MLSSQERRVWADVQRSWDETAPGPAARRAGATATRSLPEWEDAPGWVVAGAWLAIFLVLFGAVVSGVALGIATVLGWALWRRRPARTGRVPRSGGVPASRRTGASAGR